VLRPESRPQREDIEKLLHEAERLQLSGGVQQKLQWFLYALDHDNDPKSVSEEFNISSSTFRRWLKRFDPDDITSLEEKSRRPHTVREPDILPEVVELIRQYRAQYPTMGKERIHEALQREHDIVVSPSSIGRIIQRERFFFADTFSHLKKLNPNPPPASSSTSQPGVSALLLLFCAATAVFLSGTPQASAATTVPLTRWYQGHLLNSDGSAVTTAITIRFSEWKSADFTASDLTATGSINTSATHYVNWQEEHTLTPTSDGSFAVELGSITALPDLATLPPATLQNMYLQVEVKTSGAADSTYDLLDSNTSDTAIDRTSILSLPFARNADLLDQRDTGTASGSIPVLTNGGALSLDGDLTINADNAAADAVLTFGNAILAETLRFSTTNSRFEFSDDVYVEGTLSTSGALVIAPRPGTETGTTLIVDTKGLVYDATNKRVGIGTATPEAALDLTLSSATETGMIIKGAASQTTNLQEWQANDGTVVGSITPHGDLTLTGTNSPGGRFIQIFPWNQHDNNSAKIAIWSSNLNYSTLQGTSLTFNNNNIGSAGVGLGNGSNLSVIDASGNLTTANAGGLAIGAAGTATPFGTPPSNGAIISGNVGIGTTAPETKLEVVGTMSGTKLKITGTGSLSDLTFPSMQLGTSTYSTVRDFMNSFGSTGRKSGGVIADAGSSTVAVTGGTGFIKATDDDDAPLLFFDFPAPANISIPAGSTRYIGVEYNSGSPQVVARTSWNWNLDTEFPLGAVINENVGGIDELYIENNPWWVTDGTTNIIEAIRSLGLIRRDQTTGGLMLSVTGTRNIAVSAGTLWSNLNEFDLAAVDTSAAGTIEYYWYKAGTGWQTSDVSQYSVTQWNDVTQAALQTMENNKYGNVWVYTEVVNDNPSVALLYPQAQYNTAAEAEATNAPSNIPTHITEMGMLIGRIIIKKGVDTPVAVESAFGTTFSASVTTDHGNLAGLTDDDHTQYLLLTGRSGQRVNDSVEFTGTASGRILSFGTRLTGSGNVSIRTLTDSTTAFQVLDADGGNPVFNIDTDNERVGIGTTAPETALEVVGTASGNYIFGQQGLGSSGALAVLGNIYNRADNAKHYFGAGNDASITYDGTNMLINPKEVGTGELRVSGNVNIGSTTTANMAQVAELNVRGTDAGILIDGNNSNNWLKLQYSTGGGHVLFTTPAVEWVYRLNQASLDADFVIGRYAANIVEMRGRYNYNAGVSHSLLLTGGRWNNAPAGNLYLRGGQGLGVGAPGVIKLQSPDGTQDILTTSATDNHLHSPDNIKHLYGTGDDASITYDGTNMVINPKEVGSGYLKIPGTASGNYIFGQQGLGASGAVVIKKLSGTGTGNIFIVDTKGLVYDATNKRVGIGTASPEYTLDVNGGAAVSNLQMGDVGYGAFFPGLTYKGNAAGGYAMFTTNGGAYTVLNKSTADGHIGFRVNNVDKMVVDENGNVGIGTITPENRLEVVGSMSGRTLQVTGTGAAPLIYTDTTTGRVGIGTATPGYVLDVQHATDKINSKNGYLTDGADYAEYFPNEENILEGSLVGINMETGKARRYRFGDEFIGIASDGHGFVGNGKRGIEDNPKYALVGLLGQLTVRPEEVTIRGRLVFTRDGKRIGLLLENGKVLLR